MEIQTANLCHGDIHLANILMDFDQDKSTFVDPKVNVRVIDFGNSFEFVPGEMISYKGVTGGVKNLVPPEVLAANEENYDPSAFNPHQLAVNAVLILLRQEFSEDFDVEKNIERLKKEPGCPREMIDWLKELTHPDAKRKNQALYTNFDRFQTLTKELYHRNYG